MKKLAIMATAATLCAAALADVWALKPGLNSLAAARGELACAAPESTTYVLGGQYLVTGASADDSITIYIK